MNVSCTRRRSSESHAHEESTSLLSNFAGKLMYIYTKYLRVGIIYGN